MRAHPLTWLRSLGVALAAFAVVSCSGSGAEDGDGATSQSALSSAPGLLTPFGKMNPACVHAVGDASDANDANDPSDPSAAGVDVDESSAVASCLAVKPSITAATDTEPPGWVEWADEDLSSGVSFLSADFTVPPLPESVGDQVIFLFPSLTPATNPPIIQPVLQFGAAADGGGKYWSIASWYLTESANSFNSKVVKVSPGDKLRGTIEGTGTCSAGRCTSWTITLADLTQPTLKTTLTTRAGRHHFVQLQGAALETYQMDGCDQYPPSPVAFTNLTVKSNSGAALTPKWKLFANATATPACGFKATSPSAAEIDFAFTN